MWVKGRVWASLLLITLLLLSSTAIVSAQETEVFMPMVAGGNAPAYQVAPLGVLLTKAPQNNVYIVVMSADPVVTYAGQLAGYAATAPDQGDKINATSELVQSYVQFLHQSHDEVLATVGLDATDKLYSYTYALNGFAAEFTPDQVKAIASQPGVTIILRDEFRVAQDDDVPAFLGLTEAEGAWAQKYTGEDVVVGVIDSGIWPEHPSFADNGSYDLPPTGPLACDFGNTAWNPADVPFTCNNKLIGARRIP